jgi:hypothetical protein
VLGKDKDMAKPFTEAKGSTGYHDAEELMTDPPASLTPRGLDKLTEIWIVAGRPTKLKPKAPPVPWLANTDGTWGYMIDIAKLKSHHGTDAKRRAAARIRSHLIEGGYLHVTEWTSMEDAMYDRPGRIRELGLSAKAFDALIEAGVIKVNQRR